MSQWITGTDPLQSKSKSKWHLLASSSTTRTS